MSANVSVQTRVDPGVEEKATAVLEGLGLTVSDAMRILLTRTAVEGVLPFSPAPTHEAYDAWFVAKVQEAVNDPRPPVDHHEVSLRFAARRAEVQTT